jgi:hypothetical protein
VADKFDDLRSERGRAPSWWFLGSGGLPRGPRVAVFLLFGVIFWVILGPVFAALGAAVLTAVADAVWIYRERRKSGTA